MHPYIYSVTCTMAAAGKTVFSTNNNNGLAFPFMLLGFCFTIISGAATSVRLTASRSNDTIPILDNIETLGMTDFQPFAFIPRGLRPELIKRNVPLVYTVTVDAASTLVVTAFGNRVQE